MKNRINQIGFSPKFTLMMALFLLLAWSAHAVAKPELSNMRIGQKTDKTRVVFDLKGLGDYKVSQLSNPSRLVIDFYKAKNKLSFSKKFVTDVRLFKVRVSQNNKRVRVVLDLHKHGEHHAFTLPKNKAGFERLVVDLQARKKNSAVVKKNKVKNTPSKTSKIKPMLASAERKTPKDSLKINEATRSLLNKESAVFTKPKMLVVAIDEGHGG
ncbi:MAG: AMIN domain-containing protein, partial [Thiomicrorhabdus sp.]|nr:AMIN domain-containing protein [Thiomicrorhabdus sp.]